MAVSVPPAASSGATPPHNLEAETSVLGAILISQQVLDSVLVEVDLRAEDFYRPRHGLIFGAMITLAQKAEPEAVDAVTVCDVLKRDGTLEEVGGEAYVHTLPTQVAAAGHARHYAQIVKDHSKLRQLLDTTRQIQGDVMSFEGDARELVERAESKLFAIAHDTEKSEVRSIEEILHDEIEKLEQISIEGADVIGTPSGYPDLDAVTGGFQPGNLIVLAARPGMGKSALVCNIAENAAIDHDKRVALFSVEMSETELAQRFIASRANLSGDDLRKGNIKPKRWPAVMKATEKLAAAELYIDDSSDLGVLDMRAKARRLHGRKPLDLIIVDYLQLMRADDSRDSRVEQISRISRGLKILAGQLNVPVIALSQLSRAVEQRPGRRPILSDLRESGQIEADADVVMFIFREDYYDHDENGDRRDQSVEPDPTAQIIIAKHRNGPIKTIELVFNKRQPRFFSIDWKHKQDGAALAEVPSTSSNGHE